MKRVILLILALFLLFDLGEDGCLGKANYIPAHSSAKVSVVSPHDHGPGNLDCRHDLAPADLRGPPSQGRSLPVTYGVRLTRKIFAYCHAAGSGGLPL